MRTGTVITRVLAIVFALGLVLIGPAALAHHKQWHAQGGGNSAGAKSQGGGGGKSADLPNEDTDTNDNGTDNNIVDGGDNMHPSGKDKSVENGGSGNQGKSPADPDGSYNGGVDQADQPGGDDLADQDGNNGCGNDDDFEDDNNGNCGKPEKPEENVDEKEREKVAGGNHVTLRLPERKKSVEDEVLGLQARRPVDRKVIRTTDRAEDRVLARAATTAQAPTATLPFTGGDLAGFVAAGIGMLVAGAASIGVARRK